MNALQRDLKKLVPLVVRKAPTTAISDVISSKRISVSFMCKLRNKKSPPLSVF